MPNNEKSLRILEFNKITALLSELAYTAGAKKAAAGLLPCGDIYRIRKMQRQTTDAKDMMRLKGAPPFGNAADITPLLDRAEKGAQLMPRELLDIANIYTVARRLTDYYTADKRDRVTTLDDNFELLTQNRKLEDKIKRAIAADDLIADEASPELSDIRRKIRVANNRIKDVLSKYTSGAYSKYLQENIVTQRNGRFVVPVKQEYRSEVKGLVHDTSASGATVFIEPTAVLEENNRLKELESQEKHEIDRILFELSAECANDASALSYNYANITELAFIFSKASLSERMDGSEPRINEERRVLLERARHPLLEKSKAVPITVSLGGDYDTLIITGPNTGGKTVSLKTLGLLSLMAQAGLHIPADDSSEVCVFDEILADIGDEQSIEQSLSTFSAHMVNIVSIVNTADENSLVLFDELGAGTDPVEGAALAISILETMREKGALCAATTHYAELKAYALKTEGVQNAACEFDIETLKPTYRLIIGTPGKSNAFAISGKLGLDKDIIERAKAHISKEDKKFEHVIRKLEINRQKAEAERNRAEDDRREYEQFREEAEKEIKKKLESAEKELQKAETKAQSIIASAKAASDFVLAELDKLKKAKDSKRFERQLEDSRAAIRKRFRDAEEEVNPVAERKNEDYVLPRKLMKGDTVDVVTIGKRGIVDTPPDKNGSATVRIGLMNMKVRVEDLILIEEEPKVIVDGKKKTSVAHYSSSVSTSFRTELDLRGQNGEDGWMMVDKYLDDALLAGVKTVTLIHGKGTGALKAALHSRLKKDRRVKNMREGMYGEGGAGVTVLELK